MKKVMIIIRPEKYRYTKEILEQEGFDAYSVVNVLGRGKKQVEFSLGDEIHSTGDKNDHRLITKKLITIYINDEEEEKLCSTVIRSNQTEQAGDGKIFVVPVKRSIRVRTGEENENVLI
ncbi:nitrogen regulatory protein P-II [Syntrophobotulus glycolicus DSM 8271]|uniref:Nitrogen regulatory protein P-II n=1 Tax=Syntrophobotulus glycolicus (strain DSM 8271 / FlGlyR) TaxID=645991 RepID=F0T190_SYNGF|nr:P-II family nitrogen regulator [Syntrophobotulus glycolicus]ADY55154.1 nitrogen regulatory protein P-II [Syntrophobotulus glycolicus DSM 8271]